VISPGEMSSEISRGALSRPRCTRFTMSRRTFLSSAAAALAVAATRGLTFAQGAGTPAGTPAGAPAGELTRMTLRQASDALRAKRVSSLELTEACLRRIDAHQRSLNAYITVIHEQARARARAMDAELRAGKPRGPLHGVPIALKDNVDTAGIRTTAASALFADRVPTEDAEIVKKLLAAGAVILGKTNMDEFAAGGTTTSTYYGPAHNPWRVDRSSGGSSGGSGVAVAAELCFGAIGTDTGGSIRIPASWCGIVGLKPTYGRVSNRGVIPYIASRDHVGPMARSVEDTALLLQAIAGYDAGDLTSEDQPVPDFALAMQAPVSGLRIGVPRAHYFDKLDPEVAAAVEAALGVVRKLTASMRDVVLPAVNVLPNQVMAEAYAYHQRWITRTPYLYQAPARRRIENGAKVTGADYVADQQESARVRREVRAVFRDVDLLVMPTLKIPARTIADAIARAESEKPLPPDPSNTAPFNVYGLPTISVPCGFTKLGLPIGLQIAGPHLQEGRVLALARAYEQTTPWHTRRPEPPRG
jgi:aspartyl-tRNA(Asn)/glutamyl-tRNA(Gln) amidotransferase subunit A